MSFVKRLGASRAVQQTAGVLAAEYLRLVWRTSRFVLEPADFYERVAPELPVIIAMWHGQHFMAPFLKRAEHKVKVLISRHRDGEVNAIAVERLGVPAIRGSGDHKRRFDRKGGVGAFKGMLDALAEGYNMALTADIPKVSRVRRIELANWDRTEVNLPFGRFAIVVGAPIRVLSDADEAAQEIARQAVEAGLNAATARAHALVDRSDKSR